MKPPAVMVEMECVVGGEPQVRLSKIRLSHAYGTANERVSDVCETDLTWGGAEERCAS